MPVVVSVSTEIAGRVVTEEDVREGSCGGPEFFCCVGDETALRRSEDPLPTLLLLLIVFSLAEDVTLAADLET